MLEQFIEILKHTLQDTIVMLPFLFLTYIVLEALERKSSFSITTKLSHLQRYAPLCAALLGLIPQCGFSVIAAGLYVDHAISLGTLLAVFVSTSDEAVPVLLAHPDQSYLLLYILITKFIFAAVIGYLTDALIKNRKIRKQSDIPKPCACHHSHNHSLLTDALYRTLKIYAFLFVISFVLTWLIHAIGEQKLAAVLLEQSIFQPLMAALFGFIPNCAASVVLTELFVEGILSFGSLIAGLSVNAGLGFMVLLKSLQNKKELILLFAILFFSACGLGTILHLLF